MYAFLLEEVVFDSRRKLIVSAVQVKVSVGLCCNLLVVACKGVIVSSWPEGAIDGLEGDSQPDEVSEKRNPASYDRMHAPSIPTRHVHASAKRTEHRTVTSHTSELSSAHSLAIVLH
jgi:hypothetical protein